MDIKVKHLIAYLQTLEPETNVILDHDGWRENEINPKNEMELIEKRGIFDYFEGMYLCINN